MNRPGEILQASLDGATLDLRGLKCPLPALLARRALERSQPGQTVIIITTDPMAIIDLPHMCRQEGYEVLWVEDARDHATLALRRPDSHFCPQGLRKRG